MQPVVVCDEHYLFSESLSGALTRRGATVTALTSRPAQVISMLEERQVPCVVMDIGFPQALGILATRQITEGWPETRVLCMAPVERPALTRSALAAGAAAVLSKCQPLETIVDAVISGELVTPHARSADSRPGASTCLAAKFLTVREREVLHLLVGGRSTHDIAGRLLISNATARGYIQSILMKLDVHTRVEAVAYAVRHRVVDPRLLARNDSSYLGLAAAAPER